MSLASFDSDKYDIGVRAVNQHYDQMIAEIISFVKNQKPNPIKWLDTGCGTGNLTEKAVGEFPKTDFYLVDPSKEMLEKAKTKNKGARFLEPQKTQELKLGMRFDVVTSILCHHYLDEDERMDAESNVFNHLVDGGLYISFEHTMPETEQEKQTLIERWRSFQLSNGRDKQTVEKHLARWGKTVHPITERQHLSQLERIGFKRFGVLWHTNLQSGFYAIK